MPVATIRPFTVLELPEGSIELVPDFTYLGSCISSDGQMTAEISARLAKASRAFGTLRSSVFSNRDLSVKTKVQYVYSAVVLSTLLYGCETWAMKAVDVRRLAAFHHRCVRFLLDIPRETQWQEHISNTTLLERAKVQPIEETLKTRRLRWLGHVARMDDYRMPKTMYLLFGELNKTRPRHGSRNLSGGGTIMLCRT